MSYYNVFPLLQKFQGKKNLHKRFLIFYLDYYQIKYIL